MCCVSLRLNVDLRCPQGFRKYLTQSKDHDELLAFLLGGLVKDRARYFQLSKQAQPELVAVKISELEERVRHLKL